MSRSDGWDPSYYPETPWTSSSEETYSSSCPRSGPNTDRGQRTRSGSSHRPKSPTRNRKAVAQRRRASLFSKSPYNVKRPSRSVDRDHDSGNPSRDISDDGQISHNTPEPALNPPETQLTLQAGSGFTVNGQYISPATWMWCYERARSSTLMADALDAEKRNNMYAMQAMEIKIAEKDAQISELLNLVSPLGSSVAEVKKGFQKLWDEFLMPLSLVGVAPTEERQGQKEKMVEKLKEIKEMLSKISKFAEGLEKRQEMEGEK
ncbi:hypothetical protein FQN53_000784 [Emmonsiellopsis sp. PD_33]|nr:hypothetical protein FQN53_000784 [Emmonsiellopsis sp. PD_33]